MPAVDENGWPLEDSDPKLFQYSWDVDTNTIRDPSCGLCQGLPYRGPNIVYFRGVYMGYHRMQTLLAIPDVRIAAHCHKGKESILFSGSGLEGISMGLNFLIREAE